MNGYIGKPHRFKPVGKKRLGWHRKNDLDRYDLLFHPFDAIGMIFCHFAESDPIFFRSVQQIGQKNGVFSDREELGVELGGDADHFHRQLRGTSFDEK